MKKIAIRFAEIGEPTTSPTAFCSALRPSSSGRLQPSRIALSATSGAGYWPLVLRLDESLGDREGEHHLVLVEAQRLPELLAPLLPFAALLEVLDPPACPPRPADRRGRRRRPGRAPRPSGRETGSPEVIISIAGFRPISRGSRCVPPQPGIRPTLTSGRPIWCAAPSRRAGRPSTGPARCRRPCSCRRSGRRSGTAAG